MQTSKVKGYVKNSALNINRQKNKTNNKKVVKNIKNKIVTHFTIKPIVICIKNELILNNILLLRLQI